MKKRAKGGQKKQSISGQQHQREKEAGEAETGAGASKIHVSQSPHQKSGNQFGETWRGSSRSRCAKKRTRAI
jgi:hypothetical protein